MKLRGLSGVSYRVIRVVYSFIHVHYAWHIVYLDRYTYPKDILLPHLVCFQSRLFHVDRPYRSHSKEGQQDNHAR